MNSTWYDITRFKPRLLILFCIVASAFLRHLFQHQYGLLHLEVVFALLALLLICAGLAFVSRNLLAFGSVTLLLILGTYLILSRLILRPLDQLVAASREVAQGRPPQSLSTPRGNDEISNLIQATGFSFGIWWE